jgi:hypothetical protein
MATTMASKAGQTFSLKPLLHQQLHRRYAHKNSWFGVDFSVVNDRSEISPSLVADIPNRAVILFDNFDNVGEEDLRFIEYL